MTIIVSGNPRPDSRTLELARTAAHALAGTADAARTGEDAAEIELSALAPGLLTGDDPAATAALAAMQQAGVLVLATPSYKGSFTGLLKLFLDRIPGDGLAGVQVLAVVVAGSVEHAQQTERHLLDVIAALGGTALPALALTEEQLTDATAHIAAWRDTLSGSGQATA